jgi:hypothetical protein
VSTGTVEYCPPIVIIPHCCMPVCCMPIYTLNYSCLRMSGGRFGVYSMTQQMCTSNIASMDRMISSSNNSIINGVLQHPHPQGLGVGGWGKMVMGAIIGDFACIPPNVGKKVNYR